MPDRSSACFHVEFGNPETLGNSAGSSLIARCEFSGHVFSTDYAQIRILGAAAAFYGKVHAASDRLSSIVWLQTCRAGSSIWAGRCTAIPTSIHTSSEGRRISAMVASSCTWAAGRCRIAPMESDEAGGETARLQAVFLSEMQVGPW